MRTRRISATERRARLGIRHRLAVTRRTDDVVVIADAVVALHSSDPVSVYLSATARMVHPALEPVSKALYDARTLVRHHAMRRTLWVFSPAVARLAHAACTVDLVGAQHRRTVALIEASGLAVDGDAWLAIAKADTLAALDRLGSAGTRRLAAEVPALNVPLEMAPGTAYAATPAAHTRVLLLLGFDGVIVRGRPTGTWINSQYTWAPTESWLPGGLAGGLGTGAARVELARLWLHAFGPATTSDLQWWAGWTLRATRDALAGSGAVEVALDEGPGWVLADDVGAVRTPAPWVAFLPGLDPTTMGWKQRNWYLGRHGAHVFDRNGNGGPTIWADGEIVGAWVQRRSGEIAHRVLADVGAERLAAIESAAHELAGVLGDARVTVRFPSPIQASLLA
jgi:hypothetical protein